MSRRVTMRRPMGSMPTRWCLMPLPAPAPRLPFWAATCALPTTAERRSGSGQNIALFEFAGTDLADLTTYYKNAGQTEPYTPTLISTGGYATTCVDSGSKACDDTEQTLDMTQAMGMAPGSTMLYMYVCGDVLASGSGNISDTACISAMVSTTDAPLSKQISCSWGWTPADPSTLDPYFEQMASQGQNFFAAAGD